MGYSCVSCLWLMLVSMEVCSLQLTSWTRPQCARSASLGDDWESVEAPCARSLATILFSSRIKTLDHNVPDF